MIAAASRRVCAAAVVAAMTLGVGCAGPPAPKAPNATPRPYVNQPNGNSPAGILPGSVYRGLPDFALTGTLLRAGGPAGFSAERAFQTMLGPTIATREHNTMIQLYGARSVASYFSAYTYVLNTLAALARAQSFTFPRSQLRGTQLAVALIKAGTDPRGTFSMGYLLDRLMTHATTLRVLLDMERAHGYGRVALDNLNRVGNALHYDLAQRLRLPHIGLAVSEWTTTANIRTVPGTRSGTEYVYDGSGQPSADEYAARLVSVQPGRSYTFSAVVDAQPLADGNFDLMIASADGATPYVAYYGSVGEGRRYTTQSWTCPRQVRQVLLVMQVNGATINRGSSIAFSAPALEVARPARRS